MRFAIEDEGELIPWSDTIDQRYQAWLTGQESQGIIFNSYQREWLKLIKDQIAGSLTVTFEDLLDAPFTQHGGLARAREVFGERLGTILRSSRRYSLHE